MSVEEIFESERRNEDNLYDIHFYMEGSFWRVYEWSAYLSRNFPSNLNEDERLKPIKKVTKNCENGYIQVGLQLSSFDKYFPNVIDNEEIFEMSNKQIVVHTKSFFTDKDFSKYEDILNEWKNSIELSSKEKKKYKTVSVEHSVTNSIDSLLEEILSYPIENKTLIESIGFLSYIRSKIIKITKRE